MATPIAPTSTECQHRRLTWAEKQHWNALPDGAGVTITFIQEGDVASAFLAGLNSFDKVA